ncbi:MAG: hypothetical protein P8R41_10655 [Gammaproteobacteria bacterium]|jgi:hypothetical protein|nr:hypothetical protein [Gammaproteobacteria bacterium]
MVNSLIRNICSFLAAVIAAYVLGAIFVSQGNIAAIVAMDFDVSVAQRFGAVLHDVTNMTGIYLPVIAVSYLISMPVATFIVKYAPQLRMLLYVLAGATGLVAIHLILKLVLGISGIAPTRTLVGLIAQAIAGGVGGYLFHVISLKRGDNRGTHNLAT